MRFSRRWWIAATVVAIVALVLAVATLSRREPLARPVLTLRVNRGAAAQIVSGTPLTFETFLTATVAGRPVSIGGLGRPWYTLLGLESADGTALPWTFLDLGAPRSTAQVEGQSGHSELQGAVQSVATLSGLISVHVVTRGVSPEDSARAQPGVYHVRAVLSPPWWTIWRWHRRVVSAPVTVTIGSRGRDADQTESRIVETAAFYLEARRYSEARQAALAWLQGDPKNSDAYAILAEAQEGEGNSTEALKSYRKALALRPPSREEPLYLEDRLSDLLRTAGRKPITR